MSTRQAFRILIRFLLENGLSEQIGLSQEDIEKLVYGLEDDPNFYEELDKFLQEYIEDFGENYGIEWS